MAIADHQGGLISAAKVGFNDILNSEPLTDVGYIFNFFHPIIDLEPEMFRSKGTTAASITFKEQKSDTNAETIQVQILYEIYTSA